MFLNIHMLFIILKTYDKQFTLTTKKSLHIIFNANTHYPCIWPVCTGRTCGCIFDRKDGLYVQVVRTGL